MRTGLLLPLSTAWLLAACSHTTPQAPAVVPIARDGRYVFDGGGVHLEVDPRAGGRITSFALDGVELLSGVDADGESYGATFWPSPQSEWRWPPPAALDRDAYEAHVEGAMLRLRSAADATIALRVEKQVSLDAASRTATLTYRLENLRDTPRRVAAWQVTRLHPEGVTCFPTGAPAYGSGPFHALTGVHAALGYTWFAFDAAAAAGTPVEQELFADGVRGFVAHAERGVVLVQQFADVAPTARAPGEAEVEIYLENDARPAKRFVELELQGPYVEVPAHGAIAWTTRWSLHRLPPGVSARVGDPALVDFVSQIVEGSTPGPSHSAHL